MAQGTVKQLQAKKNVLKETPCPRCDEDHTLVSCPEVRCITIAEDDYNVWISVEFVPEKDVYISVAKQWKEEFGVDVTLTARFVTDDLPSFQATLQQLSDGSLDAVIVQTDEATIMPIG